MFMLSRFEDIALGGAILVQSHNFGLESFLHQGQVGREVRLLKEQPLQGLNQAKGGQLLFEFPIVARWLHNIVT
jgi:hypothetical protein